MNFLKSPVMTGMLVNSFGVINMDIKLAGLDPLFISDYKVISKKVASVIVKASTNGKDATIKKLHNIMKGRATPITASFRFLDRAQNIMVGFVSLCTESRAVDDNSLKASFKLVAANQYLGDDDNLWELRTSADGSKVMCRASDDDLDELIAKVKVQAHGMPRISSIQASVAREHELVAYVEEHENGPASMNYAFCVGRARDNAGNPVVVTAAGKPVVVQAAMVVGYYKVDPESVKAAYARGAEKGLQANLPDKGDVISYYKKVYGYDGAYLKELIRAIEEQAAL